ncbi:MAG TPA: hypothetical protein ENK19_05790, partial [Acidobacteria bacterium]|nr:hypothetical protein [Acidobacteriota bacterium]
MIDKITNPSVRAWVYVPRGNRDTFRRQNKVPSLAKVEGAFWFDGASLKVTISSGGLGASFS